MPCDGAVAVATTGYSMRKIWSTGGDAMRRGRGESESWSDAARGCSAAMLRDEGVEGRWCRGVRAADGEEDAESALIGQGRRQVMCWMAWACGSPGNDVRWM